MDDLFGLHATALCIFLLFGVFSLNNINNYNITLSWCYDKKHWTNPNWHSCRTIFLILFAMNFEEFIFDVLFRDYKRINQTSLNNQSPNKFFSF